MLNKGKHGAVGQEQARGGRKGSLNGRVIDRGHGICPKSALGAARAAMLSTAHPLLPDTTCATEGSADHHSRKRTTLSTCASLRRRRKDALHFAVTGQAIHRKDLHWLAAWPPWERTCPPREGHVRGQASHRSPLWSGVLEQNTSR